MSGQHKSRSTESFYGRRKGQQLRGRQQRLMDELLPKLRIDPSKPLDGRLEQCFPNAGEFTHLEIGFGGGEHLVHQALVHPEVNFIGVEPFINGMAKILGRIEDEGLSNPPNNDGNLRCDGVAFWRPFSLMTCLPKDTFLGLPPHTSFGVYVCRCIVMLLCFSLSFVYFVVATIDGFANLFSFFMSSLTMPGSSDVACIPTRNKIAIL